MLLSKIINIKNQLNYQIQAKTLLKSNNLFQTEDECVQSFWRMYATNGFINTINSCSINYDDFKNGSYFACFDLTTSGHCGTNYVIPSIRVGHVRLHVQFNEPLPLDLTMLLFCEFPSTMFINKTGKITTRYI